MKFNEDEFRNLGDELANLLSEMQKVRGGAEDAIESIKSLGVSLQDVAKQMLESGQGAESLIATIAIGFKNLTASFLKFAKVVITNPLFLTFITLGTLLSTIGLGFEKARERYIELDEAAESFRRTTGFTKDMISKELNSAITGSLINAQESAEAAAGLAKAFANSHLITKDLVKTTALLAQNIGISGDVGGAVLQQFNLMQGMSESNAIALAKTTVALAQMAGVAPVDVFQDLAEASSDTLAMVGKQPAKLVESAVKAKQLGMNLEKVTSILKGMLDIQTAIGAEMEASVLLGRQINMDKARELALSGDLAGAMDEVLKQVGGINEFNKLNMLQKEALAKAAGMDVQQLQKTLQLQEKLGALGKLTNEQREKYNKALAEGNYELAESILNMDKIGGRERALERQRKSIMVAFQDIFSEAFRAFQPVTDALFKLIKALIKPLGDFFKESGIIDFIASLGKGLADFLTKNKDLIVGFATTLKDIFVGVSNFFKAIFTGDFDTVGKVVGGIFDSLFEKAKSIGSAVLDFVPPVIKDTAVKVFEKISEFFGKIYDFGKKIVGSVFGVFVSAFESIKEAFSDIKVDFSWFWDTLDTIGELLGKVGKFVVGIFEGIKNAFSIETFKTIWETLKNIFGAFYEFGKSAIVTIFNSIKEAFSGINADAIDFKPIVEGITKAFSFLGEIIVGVFNSLKEVFSGETFKVFLVLLKQAFNEIKKIGGSIFEAIFGGSDEEKSAKNFSFITEILTGLLKGLNFILTGVIAGFRMLGGFVDFAGKQFQGFKSFAGGAIDIFGKIAGFLAPGAPLAALLGIGAVAAGGAMVGGFVAFKRLILPARELNETLEKNQGTLLKLGAVFEHAAATGIKAMAELGVKTGKVILEIIARKFAMDLAMAKGVKIDVNETFGKSTMQKMGEKFKNIQGSMKAFGQGLNHIISNIGKGIGNALESIGAGLPRLGKGFHAFFASLSRGLMTLANPATLIGLTAVTAAIIGIGFAIAQAAPGIRELTSLMQAFGQVVVSAINAFGDNVVKILTQAKDPIKEIIDVIGDKFVAAIEVLAPYLPAISENLARIIEALTGEGLVKILQILKDIISEVASVVRLFVDVLGSLLGKVLELMAPLMDLAGLLIGKLFDAVVKIVGELKEGFLGSLERIKGIIDSISGIIVSFGESIKRAGEGFKLMAEGLLSLTQINIFDLGKITTILGQLITLAPQLSEIGQNESFIAGAMAIGALGSGLDKLSQIDKTLPNITRVLIEFTNAVTNLGKAIMSFPFEQLQKFSDMLGLKEAANQRESDKMVKGLMSVGSQIVEKVGLLKEKQDVPKTVQIQAPETSTAKIGLVEREVERLTAEKIDTLRKVTKDNKILSNDELMIEILTRILITIESIAKEGLNIDGYKVARELSKYG